jgi:hypothetical protein
MTPAQIFFRVPVALFVVFVVVVLMAYNGIPKL